MSEPDIQELAEYLMQTGVASLSKRERRVLERIALRAHRAHLGDASDRLSFGERLADQVARFGGSWSFIIVFVCILGAWVTFNTWAGSREIFDPYPFVFLNLMLSMLAALQAPIIMMSQNRQATRDRLAAARDYEVNLKAESDIIGLHEKFDALRAHELAELLQRQQAQLDTLLELARRQVRET
ncbi:MAG TPA: DUF1003 domain-containing protein [Gammaproteobacteria bacterium]|nr:DUF1003 domain-containing protein [Gammaproteobacteria bacterium]